MVLPAKSILDLCQPGAFYLSRISHPLSSMFLGHLPGYDRVMADAKKYRDEAERMRREAIETPDRDIRGTMIEVADLCDRLADTLEKHRHQPKIH